MKYNRKTTILYAIEEIRPALKYNSELKVNCKGAAVSEQSSTANEAHSQTEKTCYKTSEELQLV